MASKPTTSHAAPTVRLLLKPWPLLAIWVALVLASLAWNLYQAIDVQTQLALRTARAFFEQVVLTRQWNAEHGGVYVPVTKTTQPNRHLKIDDRDIRASEELTLTAVNPAFMTRQLAEIAEKTNGVHFHITSLNPIRPENRPRPWERVALGRFEQGQTEFAQMLWVDGEPLYRYMAPLFTEEACLKCHAQQGYQVGDVRGGISVTLPTVSRAPAVSLIASHMLIGFFGGWLIFASTRRLDRAHQMLRQQAVLDTLTSIPNRRYFVERLVEESRHGPGGRRKGGPLALIICDIDHFKQYNDALGHQAGDRCIQAVAQVLQDGLRRGGDFCARYGGEEFVVLLPDTSPADAVKVAEYLREAVAGLAMHHPATQRAIVTVSLGVATADPSDSDHEALIGRADQALYRAKELGRNRVELQPPLQAKPEEVGHTVTGGVEIGAQDVMSNDRDGHRRTPCTQSAVTTDTPSGCSDLRGEDSPAGAGRQ